MGVSKPALPTHRQATKLLKTLKQSPEIAFGTSTSCRVELARPDLHRPQAFRPHLAAFRRAANMFRIAKLLPQSYPCPGVVIQTPHVTKSSHIARVNCDYGLRTPICTALLFRRKHVVKGTPRRLHQPSRRPPAKSPGPGAKRPPRRPTCSFVRYLQVKMALRHRTIAFLGILEGLGATPQTGPGPPPRPVDLPQRRLTAQDRLAAAPT